MKIINNNPDKINNISELIEEINNIKLDLQKHDPFYTIIFSLICKLSKKFSEKIVNKKIIIDLNLDSEIIKSLKDSWKSIGRFFRFADYKRYKCINHDSTPCSKQFPKLLKDLPTSLKLCLFCFIDLKHVEQICNVYVNLKSSNDDYNIFHNSEFIEIINFSKIDKEFLASL